MNILVVDDARDMRLTIQYLLKKLGHQVDVAVDGEDAWGKLQQHDYQVVVSDWVMPRVDGLALCQRIRSADFPHYIYIILLTGMSGKQNLISGIEAGADDFATKPAELEELKVRLRSARRVLDLEMSLALKNKSLEEAHATIQKDLEHASSTQLSVLPEPIISERLNTAWLFKPAVFVGGDTFNYFFVEPDLFVFCGIDISGHGVSSAMISMSIQTSLIQSKGLYGGAITKERAAEIPHLFAQNLNNMILNNKSEHYLTMLFGIVDFSSNKIYYVQAGHPYPFFYHHADDRLETIEVTGFPVGLFDTDDFETQVLSFASGDKFIIYSDGISENKSAINGDILENDNLYWHFDQIKALSSDAMINNIADEWLTQEQMQQLPDDVSILVLEFN